MRCHYPLIKQKRKYNMIIKENKLRMLIKLLMSISLKKRWLLLVIRAHLLTPEAYKIKIIKIKIIQALRGTRIILHLPMLALMMIIQIIQTMVGHRSRRVLDWNQQLIGYQVQLTTLKNKTNQQAMLRMVNQMMTMRTTILRRK